MSSFRAVKLRHCGLLNGVIAGLTRNLVFDATAHYGLGCDLQLAVTP
jgi:hypothetical protein